MSSFIYGPQNVKCKRFIAGLYKNKKNKQCPCYVKTGDAGAYFVRYPNRGCSRHISKELGVGTGKDLCLRLQFNF